MEDLKRKCNPIIDLSKFTTNKKILSKVVDLGYIQFCNYTLSEFTIIGVIDNLCGKPSKER